MALEAEPAENRPPAGPTSTSGNKSDTRWSPDATGFGQRRWPKVVNFARKALGLGAVRETVGPGHTQLPEGRRRGGDGALQNLHRLKAS